LGNHNRFRDRFGELRHALMADGSRFGVPFHNKDLQSLLERVEKEGSSFAKVTLPLLGKALDQGLVSGQFSCPENFALKKGTRLPRLFYLTFREIFEDSGSLCSDPNVGSIQWLRQFLLLDSKLLFEPPKSMKEKAVQEFKDRMSTLRKVRIPLDHPVLKEAQHLLSNALRGLDLSDITPGHGPGAVAEGFDRFERWDFHTWPAKVERDYPFLMYGTSSIRALVSRGKAIRLTRKCKTRICLVPKDFKGPRLISAESTAMQYLQQGQMRRMMQYISNHYLISRSVRLEDQSFNRSRASRSFMDGSATVDLSNASDTVSVPLVWYLLAGVPRLRRQLFATRSEFAVYDNEPPIRIAAFAPMGSATCFPTETLVFWALAMASVRLNSPDSASRPLSCFRKEQFKRMRYVSWKMISSSVSVFGDDVIIPLDALETFLSTLRTVGCVPNMSKTCYRTPFRESCGGEWFSGTPITIIRNRRYNYEEYNKITHYPVLLDLQRKFFAAGYRETAAVLLRWGKEIFPIYTRTFPGEKIIAIRNDLLQQGGCKPIDWGLEPLVVPSSNREETLSFAGDSPFECAFGDCPSFGDGRLKTRFNRDYQRWEYRIPVIVNTSREWGTEGYPRLLARLLSDQIDRVATRDRKVRMAWRYLPAYMGLSSLIEG
jgi:hypothetical protein